MRVAHIINPVLVDDTTDLKIAQPITFETMRMAKDFAKEQVEVVQFAAVFPEDEKIVPDYLTKTKNLERSVLDINHFNEKRKLPLIKDILDNLYESSNADYFIYSNVDIALMPQFYIEVEKIIESGYDAFVINRRTISEKFTSIEQLPLMFKEGGGKHPGYDCFVFKRENYKKFRMGMACVGANWIGRVVISNVMAFAEKFKVFEDLHLTFHIGDNRSWKKEKYLDYDRHNEIELLTILNHFLNNYQINNRNKLFDFYLHHLNSYYLSEANIQNNIPEYRIHENIISLNSPYIEIQEDPDVIYHHDFRPDGPWTEYSHQYLRQDPVFIIGYPRSGTTLVQSLLATQSGLAALHETHFFNFLAREIGTSQGKIDPDCLDHVILNIRERIKVSVNAEKHIRKIVSKKGISSKMLFEIIIIDNLLAQVNFDKIKQLRWIEKTPDHALFIDDIYAFYPDAKFIFVLRNPEKAIISRKRHFKWSKEEEWPIEKHIDRWLDSICAIETFNEKHPESVLFVRLEDVVRDYSKEIKQICTFLGAPFEKEKLNNYKNISKLTTYPWETWKKDAALDISINKVDRKSDHLSVIDRVKLNKLLAKYLDEFNYKIEFKDLFVNGMLDNEFENQLLEVSNGFNQLKDFVKIRGQMIDLANERVRDKENRISELKNNLSDKSIVEQNQKNQIVKSQGKIDVLLKSVADKDSHIKDMKKSTEKTENIVSGLMNSIQNNDEIVKELTKSIEEKDKTLKSFMKSINEKDNTVEGLMKSIKEKDNTVEGLMKTIKERDFNINNLNENLKQLDKKLEAQTRTGNLKAEKIDELHKQMKEFSNTINHQKILLNKLSSNNDRLNSELKEANTTINTIYKSWTWKLGNILLYPVKIIHRPKKNS